MTAKEQDFAKYILGIGKERNDKLNKAIEHAKSSRVSTIAATVVASLGQEHVVISEKKEKGSVFYDFRIEETSSFGVEVCSDGTIKFQTSPVGPDTILTQKQWRKEPQLIDKAFFDAYQNSF